MSGIGSRKVYTKEFKKETVLLVLERGMTVSQVSEDLEIGTETIYRWIRTYKSDPINSFPGKGRLKPEDDAILLAQQPGISSTVNPDPKDDYANSGYGLYMTSNICKTGGDFVIASGTRLFGINARFFGFFDNSFKGTAIRMRLSTNNIYSLSKISSELLEKGEQIARNNKKSSVITASKVTKLLTQKNIDD